MAGVSPSAQEPPLSGGPASGGRRPGVLEALYAISAGQRSASEPAGSLERNLERILDAFDFATGTIRLLDPPTGELRVAAVHARDPEPAIPATADEPLIAPAVRDRRLSIVRDLPGGPYAASPWARGGYRTFVAVPLQCRGMVLGCLTLAAREDLPLGREDQEYLETLAGQIALAVAGAELHGAERRRIEYLSALHRCSRDLGPAPDLDVVLRVTAERMAELLGMDRVAVLSWGPDGDGILGTAASGFAGDAVRALVPEASLREAAAAVAGGARPFICDDPLEEGLLPEQFVRAHRIGPILAVPLVAREQTLGLLLADRGGERIRLSPDELELAMIFANQAAVWIAGAALLVQERAARAAAQAAEARFRGLLELAPDAIVLVDGDGCIRLLNEQAERLFGYPRDELVGQPVEVLVPARLRAAHRAHRASYHAQPRTRLMGPGLDLLARRRDGSEFTVEISLGPAGGDASTPVLAVVRDVTERIAAAREREALLARERKKGEQLKLSVREAHHRIKNNLQAIADLLYLEAASAKVSSPSEVLRDSIERIQSIAAVHDLLSQEEDVQTVDMRALAERLVPKVLQSSSASPVALDLDVVSVALSSKRGTILALILTELVSNAARHAFPGGRAGSLAVALTPAGDDGLVLRVVDDGPGLKEGFDPEADASVGLQVVRTLAERDLNGKLSLSAGPGLTAEVWFPW